MIKKKKKKSYKKFIFGGLFFCLVGAVAYFLIWSPFFWIKEIKISAEKEPMHYSFAEIEEIAKEQIENKFFYFIPQKSIALVSTEEIKKNILERFSEIRSADVVKKAPSILKINIEEREGVGIWCSYSEDASESRSLEDSDELSEEASIGSIEERKIEDCFKIDREGVIFKESPLIGGNLVLNIYSAKNSSAKIRDEVIPPKVINFILTAKEGLSKIKVAERTFPAVVNFEFVSIEELRAKTIQGWWIYFNPAVLANLQINTLETVIDNEIKGDLSLLEYIDLRIEGRVYYK